MKRLAGALLVVATTAAAAVLPSTAAMATTASPPQCTTFRVINGADVPTSSGGSINCWLAEGDYSSAVWAMQMAFKYCQDDPSLAADWDYGPATKAAVLQFQRNIDNFVGYNLLAQDGVYGPATRSEMDFHIVNGGCVWVG